MFGPTHPRLAEPRRRPASRPRCQQTPADAPNQAANDDPTYRINTRKMGLALDEHVVVVGELRGHVEELLLPDRVLKGAEHCGHVLMTSISAPIGSSGRKSLESCERRWANALSLRARSRPTNAALACFSASSTPVPSRSATRRRNSSTSNRSAGTPWPPRERVAQEVPERGGGPRRCRSALPAFAARPGSPAWPSRCRCGPPCAATATSSSDVVGVDEEAMRPSAVRRAVARAPARSR